jgi:hypothetical protein
VNDKTENDSYDITVHLARENGTFTSRTVSLFWTVVKNGDPAKDFYITADSYVFTKGKNGGYKP